MRGRHNGDDEGQVAGDHEQFGKQCAVNERGIGGQNGGAQPDGRRDDQRGRAVTFEPRERRARQHPDEELWRHERRAEHQYED